MPRAAVPFVAVCVVGTVLHAQDTGPSGIIAQLDISQRLEASDNPDLTAGGSSDIYGRTRLDFRLRSETRTQNFQFSLGTDIEEGRRGQSSIEADNTRAALSYGIESSRSTFDLELGYREVDISSTFFDEDALVDDGDGLVQDTGTRTRASSAVSGSIGIDQPIGASYNLSYTEIGYSGTADPTLRDRNILDFSSQVNFRFDQRIQGRVTSRYIEDDIEAGGVSRTTRSVGAGLRMEVTPRLVADVAVSYDEVERSGAQTGKSDGLSVTVDLTQQMSNGTAGLSFSSEVSSNVDGRRSFLRFSRDMQLSPISTLAFSLGVTQSESSEIDPVLSLDYSKQMPSGQFSLGLSQTVASNSDNREQINTRLRAQYDYSINAVSSIGVRFAVFDRNLIGAGGNDARRYDVGVTYRRDLTEDWDFVGGYTHRFSDSDTQPSRRSNTLFVAVERSFDWIK